MLPAQPRILLLNHVARVGGAERSLLELVRHTDRQRFELVAAVPAGGELGGLLEDARVRVHPLPLQRLRKTANPFVLGAYAANLGWVVGQLVRLIKRERIALVHANSNTAQLYGGLAARACGVPCLWHARDLVNLGPLVRWLSRLSATTIAISEAVRQHVGAAAGGAGKLVVVHNGVDPVEFQPRGRGGRVREELGLPREAPVFGMVGQLVPWKAHRAFLEAAARIVHALPAARFLLVGADLFGEHTAYREGLQARAAELGLTEKVVFTGQRPDIRDVLEALDVLIHPAVREPLGRVLLEAMALGRPVVAVAACGPAEIIRDRQDGLLTATGSPPELAEAALSIACDPALAARLGTAARERVVASFNSRDTAARIQNVYDELLAA